MMNDSTSNSNSSDSSIFQGKIRPEDLDAVQEVNKLKGATEELFKELELQKQGYEELGEEASSEIQGVLTSVMLGDGGPTDGGIVEETLAELGKFFQSLFSEFEIELDPKTYEMIKERREKSCLAAIIKFLRDKLKELIKKVFSRDLSFDERIDKEIKELEERLLGGGLSKGEEVAILERLEALRELKLKLQMAIAGWIVAMVAEIFAVELVVAAEGTGTAKEEDKKAEKTSSKKEVEVCKEIEVKVGKNEELRILPISLFVIPARDQSNGLIIPPLKPEERNLLRERLKNLIPPEPKHDINKENREVKETKVEENKRAKSENPKKEAAPKKKAEGSERKKSRSFQVSERDSRRETRDNSNKLPAHNYPIGDCQEQALSEITNKFNASTKHEPQQSSMGGAQEKILSGVTNIKVDNHGDLIGKAPEKAPSR